MRRKKDQPVAGLTAMVELNVLREALLDWHMPTSCDGEGHSSFTDSTALTHCICFGAGHRVLRWLEQHPAEALAWLADLGAIEAMPRRSRLGEALATGGLSEFFPSTREPLYRAKTETPP